MHLPARSECSGVGSGEVAMRLGPIEADFDLFWAKYPRRVAKLAAMKAFAKARTVATLDELLAGVDNYIRHKPDYADWAHASSWLNAGRWMDEYEVEIERPKVEGRENCRHEPKCPSNIWHRVLL